MAGQSCSVNSSSDGGGNANGPSLSGRMEKAISSLNSCVAFLCDLEDFLVSVQSPSTGRVMEFKRKNKELQTLLGSAESKYSTLKCRFKRLSRERDELASWNNYASYLIGQFRAADERIAELETALNGKILTSWSPGAAVEEEDLEVGPEELHDGGP